VARRRSNGMVYVRGIRRTRPLAGRGRGGLELCEVLPYFRRAETRAKAATPGAAIAGAADADRRAGLSALPRIPYCSQASGYAETDDINGFRQEGFGRFDMTVHRGERWSAARAYLARQRGGDLSIVTQGPRDPIQFVGRRAVGVDL